MPKSQLMQGKTGFIFTQNIMNPKMLSTDSIHIKSDFENGLNMVLNSKQELKILVRLYLKEFVQSMVVRIGPVHIRVHIGPYRTGQC